MKVINYPTSQTVECEVEETIVIIEQMSSDLTTRVISKMKYDDFVANFEVYFKDLKGSILSNLNKGVMFVDEYNNTVYMYV